MAGESGPADRLGAGDAAPADIFGDAPIIQKAELVAMRAGFINAAGLIIEFGANVRTFVDGLPVLEAIVTLTEAGFVTEQTIPQADSGAAPFGATLVVGDGSGTPLAQVSPTGLDLSALAGTSGVVLNGDDGFTAALHRIVSDQILSAIVTTDSERSIDQQLDVIVTIMNFSQFLQEAQARSLGLHLSESIR